MNAADNPYTAVNDVSSTLIFAFGPAVWSVMMSWSVGISHSNGYEFPNSDGEITYA